MTDDFYMVAIAVLLPLSAGMLMLQTNPYHALVIRGILGALAALVYALFGAADVALTEALVGTMLSITLYAIAVRSSMRMCLGVLESPEEQLAAHPSGSHCDDVELLSMMRHALQPYHVRLELIPFETPQALQTALRNRDLHGTLTRASTASGVGDSPPYQLQVRVQRLAEILKPELPPAQVNLTLVDVTTPDATEDTSPQTDHSTIVHLNPGADA